MSLPDFRVNEERPFKYTGINYCEPVYIKTTSHTKKNYIALITCAATRMIHLQLVRDLLATSLVQYLKRFIGRKELPKLMLFLYVYVSGTILRLTKSFQKVFHPFGLVLDFD